MGRASDVDLAGLVALGEAFGRALRPPAVVALSGELGAGKTTLARAVAAGLGVRESVTSPTFALVHRYAGAECVVYHVDAYRLRGAAEAADLGFDDMLAEGEAVILVEWPERLGRAMPSATHRFVLAHTGDPSTRRVETP